MNASAQPHASPGGSQRASSIRIPAWENDRLDTCIRWVQANQTTAMLSAFAFGVFIGTLMRD